MVLHEARFSDRLAQGRVLCTLCPHYCRISDGGRGACAVRYNLGGRLYTLVYDRVVAHGVDPIEKKPLFHFYPGSRAFSVATVGCNLRCAFCQNWQIAEWPRSHLGKRIVGQANAGARTSEASLDLTQDMIPGDLLTPHQIVERTQRSGCASIAYTYTEPTIFYELAYDTAALARAKGLKNVFVTNGFTSEAPLREIAPLIDAVNVDLKAFKEETYRRVSRSRLGPVLDAIRLYRSLGVWVEVTTLVIPGLNDSDQELQSIAEFICSVGVEVPWHVSRFHPAYQMSEIPPTPVATLRRAFQLGKASGLRYVYIGNVAGAEGEDTRCFNCLASLIERVGFTIRKNRIIKGSCPDCDATIDGVGMTRSEFRGSPGAARLSS